MKKKIVLVGLILCIIMLVWKVKGRITQTEINNEIVEEQNLSEKEIAKPEVKRKITDWKLILVNHENALPSDFSIELADIDKYRKFDARAIGELKQMLESINQAGITNVWVQSAYRSVERQKMLFDKKINAYLAEGNEKEIAEGLALRQVNQPGTSEHNLGLAVDFNYVDESFDETEGFQWLQENAENFGFILRYEREKEMITQVDYEPWHWRYVGKENAIKMNELDMCLEEYIEFLKGG